MRNQDQKGADASPAAEGQEPKHGAIGHLSADEELQQTVCAALIESARLDSKDIGVRVANGTVILTGSVRSSEDRDAAAQVAGAQSGVWEVETEALGVDQR